MALPDFAKDSSPDATSVPDYTEPIVAVKAWKATPVRVPDPPALTIVDVLDAGPASASPTIEHHEELRLQSPYRSLTWVPGEEAEAECSNPVDAFVNQWQVNAGGTDYYRQDLITMSIEIQLSSFGSETLKNGLVIRLDSRGQPIVEQLKAEPSEPPPHPGHSCGIYALSTFKDIEGQVLHLDNASSSAVYGLVELTGRIIPGSSGWRAQRAKISALVEVHPIHKLLGKSVAQLVAQLYDVPIFGKKEAEKLVSNPDDFGAKSAGSYHGYSGYSQHSMPPSYQRYGPGSHYHTNGGNFSVTDPHKPIGEVLKGGIS